MFVYLLSLSDTTVYFPVVLNAIFPSVCVHVFSCAYWYIYGDNFSELFLCERVRVSISVCVHMCAQKAQG